MVKHPRPIHIRSVTGRDSLRADAGSFVRGWSLDKFAGLQDVVPLRDAGVLPGGWPGDHAVDATAADIYRQRQ